MLCPLSYRWVFIHEKAYQVTDTGIESSVMTKVKGFGYHQNRIMDVADYVYPPQVCGTDNTYNHMLSYVTNTGMSMTSLCNLFQVE